MMAGGTSRNRPRALVLITLIFQLVLINFLLDPFNGNELLSFSLTPDIPGGIFRQTSTLWTDGFCGYRGCRCVAKFNGYFQYSWQYITHQQRVSILGDSILPPWYGWDNEVQGGPDNGEWNSNGAYGASQITTQEGHRRPAVGSGQFDDVRQADHDTVRTFGYCARDWIGTLLYLGGISTIFVLLTTVTLIVALIQSIKLEKIRKEEDVVEVSKVAIVNHVRAEEFVQPPLI